MNYDVFNGDADGICALQQLRLAEPRPGAQLVSGVKRDIKLLDKIQKEVQAGDELTVLDISMAVNMDPLTAILAKGCKVFYADHHFAGDIPQDPALTAHINPEALVCTSLIVDKLLKGRYRPWAVAAAFGDNLHEAARAAGEEAGLSAGELGELRELGELMNYNGYGATPDDLYMTPQELYGALAPYEDPFEFYHESPQVIMLREGFAADMAKARAEVPLRESASGRVYLFNDLPWCRRVAGVFSNERARERQELAHALLVNKGDGTFMVSVRAPLARRRGADTLCMAFPSGGGRTAAAGINALPEDMLTKFLDKFEEVFAP